MPSPRHLVAARPARPNGPRCHGGASSLLRIAQRASAPANARSLFAPRDTGYGDGAIELVLGLPSALPGR